MASKSVFICVHPWFILRRVKLISWNVNGLRAVLKKNFLEYLAHRKARRAVLAGNQMHARPGSNSSGRSITRRSGIARRRRAIPARQSLRRSDHWQVTPHLGIIEHDNEGRVLTAEYENFFLVNVYTPNSKRELERLPYRQVWDVDFLRYLKKLGKEKARDFLWRPQCGAHGD